MLFHSLLVYCIRSKVKYCICSFLVDKPLSECQKKQAEVELSPSVLPEVSCKPDGSYSDIQCDKIADECWCVDEDGNEVLGTRSLDVVKCSQTGN